ncbi:hypothetical protein [Bifidobacterium jacchi]|uniref:Uncharacterized protein n=1 Tax=Bifidobacterium jacchi TaxID=2490545 RepID=A0A5N5RI67_9BIFI|nr:hypothetical protein [Bifidobacterium jacchi]KAB5606982.1 hypothetical protein EHS19_05945 [Bifidobacterium jacchi]
MDVSKAEQLAKAAYPERDICGASENDMAYVFFCVYLGPDKSELSEIAVDKADGSAHLLIPGSKEYERYRPDDAKVLWTPFYEPGFEETERGWRPPDKELEGIDDKIEQMLMTILRREGMDDDIAETVECINAGEWDVGISLGFEALLREHIKLDEESLDLFGKFARWYADDGYLDDDFLEQYESFKKL